MERMDIAIEIAGFMGYVFFSSPGFLSMRENKHKGENSQGYYL